MATSNRSNDLKRAALLRERILGCLRGSLVAMSVSEVCGYSGVVELYHAQLLPQKVAAQLAALVKSGHVTKVERGRYAITKKGEAPAEGRNALQSLQLEVHKRDKVVTFTFEGLQITVKILP